MPLTQTQVCTLNLFRGSGVAAPEAHLNEGENTEQNPRAHPVTQPGGTPVGTGESWTPSLF